MTSDAALAKELGLLSNDDDLTGDGVVEGADDSDFEETVVCLLSSMTFDSLDSAIAHMKSEYDFDILALISEMRLDTMQAMRLVNYMRQTYKSSSSSSSVDKLRSRSIGMEVKENAANWLNNDIYLKPVIECDPFLYGLPVAADDGDDDSWAEDDSSSGKRVIDDDEEDAKQTDASSSSSRGSGSNLAADRAENDDESKKSLISSGSGHKKRARSVIKRRPSHGTFSPTFMEKLHTLNDDEDEFGASMPIGSRTRKTAGATTTIRRITIDDRDREVDDDEHDKYVLCLTFWRVLTLHYAGVCML